MAWGGPQSLGNVVAQIPPSAVSWAPHRLDVFAADANTSQLAHWWSAGARPWGGPQLLGGSLGSGPSAVSWAPHRLDVFAADANTRQLAHWWSAGAHPWGGPQLL